MKTLIRARSLAVLLAAMLGGLLSAKPAQAARFVKFGIFLNGQYILVAGTYDNGHTDKDGQWDYLKKLPLTTPRGVDFAELMPPAECEFLRDDLRGARPAFRLNTSCLSSSPTRTIHSRQRSKARSRSTAATPTREKYRVCDWSVRAKRKVAGRSLPQKWIVCAICNPTIGHSDNRSVMSY